MRMEYCDRRILGALQCVDAVTGLPITSGLQIVAPGLRLQSGRSGRVVIHDADGLGSLREISSSFAEQPSAPPPLAIWPEEVTLTIRDISGRFLPRIARISLPREAAPSVEPSLFTPIRIPLYPSPTSPIRECWAVLRATVLAATPAGSARRLPWAWLRLKAAGNGQPNLSPLSRAQADWRGEALLVLRSLPQEFGEAGHRLSQLSIDLEVVFDPILQDLPEDLEALEPPAANKTYLPDPDLQIGRAHV